METCFVADDVASFVARQARRRSAAPGADPAAQDAAPGSGSAPAVAVEALDRPATVVDPEGRELGQGAPYYRYTVGQRRGLGVSGVGERAGERLYVLSIDPAANRVTAGGVGELASRGLIGSRLHWINPDLDLADADRAGVEATIKLRSRHPGAHGVVRPLPGGAAEVTFAEPQTAVAPGQAAVFYRDGRVLGGCWIERGLT